MQRIPKTVFIIFIIGLGVFNLISISTPTIDVNITESNVDLTEQWIDETRDIRYPVTVEKDWNHSLVTNIVIDDVEYIYWIVPIQENRKVDFHFDAPFRGDQIVFNETQFLMFQWGIGTDRIVEKDAFDSGILSFVCNSTGDYVFVCSLNQTELVPIRVSWVFSTLDDPITSFWVEIRYDLQVETRTLSKKVSFVEKLILDFRKWSPFSIL